MKLAYTAYDRGGKAAAGTVEAGSVEEARDSLRRQGMFVTEIHEADDSSSPKTKQGTHRIGRGQRLKNLAMLSRQLHVLISSGTPIVQALNAIERQCQHENWRSIVAELRRRVEEGAPLSEAMRLQPQHFDSVCRSLVSAGEASGNLPVMLDRLAALTRKQVHLRSAIVGALVYPVVLIGIGMLVLVGMLLFVLPRFAILFESLDSPLPPTTRMLMWASDVLWNYWWAVLIIAIAGGISAYFWLASESGRQTLHRITLSVPKLGLLSRSIMSARLSRMLGTLIESRVPLMDALQLTRNAAVILPYQALLQKAEDAVSRGEPISAILGHSDLIAPCVQEALRNGETSGQLGQPLLHMADFLDEENDVVVKSLTSIIEPAILIGLGVVVGFIALSMFLPLFDLVSASHGGG